MARPTSKAELIELAGINFNRLLKYIADLDDSSQKTDFPPATLNRNIADVLCHLHEWHNMMIRWYTEGMRGEKPDMPAKGFTWRTTSDLNRVIQKRYEKIGLNTALNLVADTHNKVMNLIGKHTDEELFTKKKYHWTGSTSLGAYFISATSSHYDWAYKLINRCLKKT